MRIPRDPALPALQDVFPGRGAPEFVASAVHEMTGRDVDAARARIRFVRYRPGKSCVVLWVFHGGDAPLMVSGKLFRDERGAGVSQRAAFQRQGAEAGRRLGGAETYRYLPEQQLLLQLYPMDSRMPALMQAEDESWLRDALAPALGTRAIRLVSAEPVSYKPWRRCVYEYHLEVDGVSRRFFGKVFLDDRGAKLCRWLAEIERRLRARDAPWRIVAPVTHIDDAHLLVIEGVDGATEFKDIVKAGENGAGREVLHVIERAAEGLAAFHEIDLDGLDEMPPHEVVHDYAAGAEGIDVVAPEFAASAFRALAALDEQARRLRPERLVLTHGAFRHDQFLLAGEEMVAMDLDTLCRSGASADAGNFLGYLDVTGVRRPELRAATDRCAEAFSGTLSRLPDVSQEWTSWYRAAAHLKKALRSFYSLDPKWPQTVDELLSRAERALSSGAML